MEPQNIQGHRIAPNPNQGYQVAQRVTCPGAVRRRRRLLRPLFHLACRDTSEGDRRSRKHGTTSEKSPAVMESSPVQVPPPPPAPSLPHRVPCMQQLTIRLLKGKTVSRSYLSVFKAHVAFFEALWPLAGACHSSQGGLRLPYRHTLAALAQPDLSVLHFLHRRALLLRCCHRQSASPRQPLRHPTRVAACDAPYGSNAVVQGGAEEGEVPFSD